MLTYTLLYKYIMLHIIYILCNIIFYFIIFKNLLIFYWVVQSQDIKNVEEREMRQQKMENKYKGMNY